MILETPAEPPRKRYYRLYTDPQFIALALINGLFIFLYERNLEQASTIIFTYYLQSVLIGVFHFIRLASQNNVDPASVEINDRPLKSANKAKWFQALFFMFHYGFFHFVYLIFLVAMLTDIPGRVDLALVGGSITALILGATAETRRHIQNDRKQPTANPFLFFLPYVRIVPMHIFIIISFTNFQPEMFLYFLLLKTAADLLGYMFTAPWRRR